ncbi:MAG: hypothetical protein LBH46_04335 [Rickettsiales bacterium]|jgi:hypothetical protein|nr:hypothetical protein [Rickettsiales bacterium]
MVVVNNKKGNGTSLYHVSLSFSETIELDIEAESKQEAINKIIDEIDIDDIIENSIDSIEPIEEHNEQDNIQFIMQDKNNPFVERIYYYDDIINNTNYHYYKNYFSIPDNVEIIDIRNDYKLIRIEKVDKDTYFNHVIYDVLWDSNDNCIN